MNESEEIKNDIESGSELDDCQTAYNRNYGKLRREIRSHQESTLHLTLTKNKFTDVTFIVGANKVKFNAIRSLMAAISPVFEAMLFGAMKESQLHSEIVIQDIEENGFRSIINFAYMQEPNITTPNIVSVYKIADKYQILVLSSLCETLFHRIIKHKNLCLFLSDSVYFKANQFINLCKHYLSEFAMQPIYMLKSAGFLKMNVDAMKVFLQCDDLNITEDDLWQYIVKWIKYKNVNGHDRKIKYQNSDDAKCNDDTIDVESNHLLKEIYPFIRFGAMSPKYFIENVKPYLHFLKEKEIISILTEQITEKYPNPRNVIAAPHIPFKDLAFEDKSCDDTDYDEYNEEDKEQYLRDQEEEDEYYSTEEQDSDSHSLTL